MRDDASRSVGRRSVLLALAAVAAGVATTGVATPQRTRATRTAPVLLRGSPRLLTGAGWRKPGDAPGTSELRWLARGRVPATGTRWEPMVRYAMLDLRRLTNHGDGWSIAGAADHWGYTWPRDSAFFAVAFAATGHRDLALRALAFLRDVQRADGGFEARYRADGSVPDDRTAQTDGAGLVLWALGSVLGTVPDRDLQVVAAPLRPLLDRAVAFVLAATDDGRALPAPSPDYWEVRESAVTLGTAAPLAVGLRSAASLYARLGEDAAAASTAEASQRYDRVVHAAFGPGGYQRYTDRGGQDAAVCYLLPPFAATTRADVVRAWRRYQVDARRPGGGLAPGVGWRRDGVSWTPEVALVALSAAAMGDDACASDWLDWLDAQRTDWESLPEKVLADGSPAGPAPLGWTAANVVLAALHLTGTRRGVV